LRDPAWGKRELGRGGDCAETIGKNGTRKAKTTLSKKGGKVAILNPKGSPVGWPQKTGSFCLERGKGGQSPAQKDSER